MTNRTLLSLILDIVNSVDERLAAPVNNLPTLLGNIYAVADRLHDPDQHMGESICDGCYIKAELRALEVLTRGKRK